MRQEGLGAKVQATKEGARGEGGAYRTCAHCDCAILRSGSLDVDLAFDAEHRERVSADGAFVLKVLQIRSPARRWLR